MAGQLPSELLEDRGPFVSVYLDVSKDSEDADRQTWLRWRAACEELTEAGADQATLDAMAEAIADAPSVVGTGGRAVIAAHGKVLRNETFPQPPPQQITEVAGLPRLMPLFLLRPTSKPYILALCHHSGALVHAFDDAGNLVAEREATADDRFGEVGTAPSPKHEHELHANISWDDNVRAAAAEIDRATRLVDAQVVLLAGEVRARAEVAAALGPPASERAVVTDVADQIDDPALRHEAEQLLQDQEQQYQETTLAALVERLGQPGGRAVVGLPDVVPALRTAAVSTLVVQYDPTATQPQLWVGDEPSQVSQQESELSATSPRLERADSALVRAALATGAELVVMPHPDTTTEPARPADVSDGTHAPVLPDGVGALLRFRPAGEPG